MSENKKKKKVGGTRLLLEDEAAWKRFKMRAAERGLNDQEAVAAAVAYWLDEWDKRSKIKVEDVDAVRRRSG